MFKGSQFKFNDEFKNYSTVWEISPTNEIKNVTAPFPNELPTRAVKSCSDTGDIVIDPYLGSGTTLIACEQTDRTCYGMELDEKYLDVIRKRWAKYVYPDRWENEWESLTPAIET